MLGPMRIAISGAHSLGKSTLVNDWAAERPGRIREEEPYRVLGLHGPYDIRFRDESTRLQNGIQLHYSIGRVVRYATSAADVVFDRAPVDFVAYSQYTADCGTTDIDDAFVESMVPAVREALEHLDIVGFVPISSRWPVEMEDDGIRPIDLDYRADVDRIFTQIYREGRFDVMPRRNAPLLVELCGPRGRRLEQLREAVAARGG